MGSSTPPQPQEPQHKRCRAARCVGSASCLNRLFMIPVFMMSMCCPLCTLISAAFFFCSFHSSCGSGGFRCCPSICNPRWVDAGANASGSGSCPRFHCRGTTAQVATAPAPAAAQPQKQPNLEPKAPSALQADSAVTLEPLLQEEVAKDESGEEDASLQCALAEPDPQPQLEPEPQQDKTVQPAKPKEQNGEKGETAS